MTAIATPFDARLAELSRASSMHAAGLRLAADVYRCRQALRNAGDVS